MPSDDKFHNIFVCHSWDHHTEEYDRLLRILREQFWLRDLSVPRYRSIAGSDDKVWHQIATAIDNCEVMLVINTPAIAHSKYTQREIRYAHELNKPIISLNPRGDAGWQREGRFIEQFTDRRCSWSGPSIMKAISDARNKT